MKTGRFQGGGPKARRDFWDTVAELVDAQTKEAGKNVKVTEFDGYGTIIDVIRERSGTPPAGCPCSLPTGDCVHVLCFGLKLDAAEVEYGGQGGTPFQFASYSLIPYYAEDGPGWYFETPSNELYIAFDPAEIKDRTICFQVVLKYESGSDQFESYLVIDGVQSDSVFDDASLVDDGSGIDRLQIGSRNAFGNTTHRSIFAPTVITSDLAQFPTGTVFQFPANSFTSTSGSTISLSGDEVRIDTDATSGSVYAEKDFDPFYHLTCPVVGACCIDGVCSIRTETDCIGAGGTYQGDDTDCDSYLCITCVHDASLCLSFSGIETCPCYFVSGSTYLEISDVSMNGTFELPQTVDPSGGVGQWEGSGGTVHLKKWSDGLCEGTPDLECDCPTYLIVQCICPPAAETTSHFVGYFILAEDACAGGTINLFQSGSTGNGNIAFGTPEDNLNDCITTTHGVPLGQNGTVTIEAGPCA